ncbi:MAG: PAS domain-containing protein, partial [Candidatus Acetothermia bacterium]
MTGAEVAFFEVRDQQKDELVTAAVSAPEELLAEISSAGHVNLVGRRWKPDQGYLEDIKGRRIATFDGLGELVGQSLSPGVSDVLEEYVNPGDVAFINVTKDDELLGGFTLVMPSGGRIENESLAKIYSQQVASFLARTRAERDLRKKEKLHRIISQLSSDYFYSLEVDTGGALDVEWISGSFERMTTYPVEEITNFDQWLTHIHPEDAQLTQSQLDRLLDNESVTNHYRLITKDGRVRWFRDRLRPEWGSEEERVVRVYGAVKDITDRVEAEKEIQDLNDQQRLLLDNIDVQVWYLSDAETYGKINEAHARFLGVDRDEAEGKSLFALLDPEEARACIRDNEKVFREQEKVRCEEWITDSCGDRRLIAISEVPKLDEDGEVSSVICAARDITELRHKKRLRELINVFSNELIGVKAGELDPTIDGMLEDVGEFVGADRVYLFQFSDDQETMNNTHEWCGEGIEPQKDKLQDLPSDIFPWWMEKLHNHENILVPQVSELP